MEDGILGGACLCVKNMGEIGREWKLIYGGGCCVGRSGERERRF